MIKTSFPKPSQKIRTAIQDYGLYHIFLKNKLLRFSRAETFRIWNLTKFQLIQLIQTIFNSIFSTSCLIELKFCEVLWNSFSNRFLRSILKNKNVLIQTSFVYCPNFRWWFCRFLHVSGRKIWISFGLLLDIWPLDELIKNV